MFVSKYLNKVKLKDLADEYALVVRCEGEEEDIVNEPVLVDRYNLNFTKEVDNTNKK